MASTFARELRRNPTDAELRLWSRLRGKQLDGFRFRRQQQIGPYIADFYCAEAKLIIEVDGGHHANDSDVRSKSTETKGYRIIRFWNNDALTDTDGVLMLIQEVLRATPHPALARRPPPQGGRRSDEPNAP